MGGVGGAGRGGGDGQHAWPTAIIHATNRQMGGWHKESSGALTACRLAWSAQSKAWKHERGPSARMAWTHTHHARHGEKNEVVGGRGQTGRCPGQ